MRSFCYLNVFVKQDIQGMEHLAKVKYHQLIFYRKVYVIHTKCVTLMTNTGGGGGGGEGANLL